MPQSDESPRRGRSRRPGSAASPSSRAGRSEGDGDPPEGTGSGSGGGDGSTTRELPHLGEKIDEFRLLESIGAGGMGAVFRAVDLGLDRQVALKILPPDQAVDPEVVRRYHQEGRAAARLDHENIARIYTIGDDGRYHYIAFEYIEGINIRQKVLREGPLPVAEAVAITLQIAHALVHAAGREVVHRDIKPSNIIVTPEGRAKLVDMGLARHFERRGDADLTQTGMTLGTFDYISPEQARDPRDVDIRGDLYSLGCTLFHMLSGRPPFPEGTVLQKLLQHREEDPTDIRRLNAAVPDGLAAILARLLAKDRDRRYQTPDHLARDLARVATRRATPSTRATPAWARHLFWISPGLAFLLVFAAMIWWGDGPTPPRPVPRDNPNAVAATPPFPADPFAARPAPPAPATPTPATPPAAPSRPRVEAVTPRDDLARALADAPPKSTVILTERGPYELRPGRLIRLDHKEVTIRAEAGVRPLIRLARDLDPSPDPGRVPVEPDPVAALVDVRGGRVAFEGIDFLVDPSGFEAGSGAGAALAAGVPRVLAAIFAEDAEVTVRRCSFRRVGASALGASAGVAAAWRPAAIRLVASPRIGTGRAAGSVDAPGATLVLDASDFDGHQVGLLATGPVDVAARDVAFGPALADQAAIWAENADAAATPAEFRLDHASGLLGAGPMFRFAGTAPRVLARHSVFGPSPDADTPAATLVAIDAPDRLDWRGADNLFARVGAFLQATGPRPGGTLRTFAAWADDPASFRESGSVAFDGVPWERLPVTSLTPAFSAESPRSFRLALPRTVAHHPGARWGPLGPLPPPLWLASAAPPNRLLPAEPPPTPAPGPAGDRPAPPAGLIGPPMSAPGRSLAPPPAADPDDLPPGFMPMPMPDPDRPPADVPPGRGL